MIRVLGTPFCTPARDRRGDARPDLCRAVITFSFRLLGLLEGAVLFPSTTFATRALGAVLLVAGLQCEGEFLCAGEGLGLGAAGDCEASVLVEPRAILANEFCRDREFARAEVACRGKDGMWPLRAARFKAR